MNQSIKSHLERCGSDLRIEFLRGLANWFIFLDHIPNNVVNLVTLRNFGFSGATDVFVFVAGYAAAIFFGRMAIERSFVVTATRILARVWKLYAAYIVLFVIYVDVIGSTAAEYAAPEMFDEYNITGFVDHPARTLLHGLMLQAKPLNLDTLQLFIPLMTFFPLVLWLMLRRPNWTLAGSVLLYCAARQFDWSLPSFPSGTWYFNPFCWQLLYVLGAWFALNGAELTRMLHGLRPLRAAAVGYLVLALGVAVVYHAPAYAKLMPDVGIGFGPITPDGRENLAPARVLHLLALAFVFSYFVPRDFAPLRWRLLQPIMKCGEQWIAVFCIAVFLSFAGHLVLVTGPNSLLMQVLVSVAGLAIMTGVAYYISWSKRQDHHRLAFN
ncbi:MAG: OpgC domain-containing protein [Bradyrhizobium sp.]|uniref:OpgC domain-containing protein n=1 Tax=Bradyrhizobium sp. TaxID=376 RepID=UPI001DE7F757|nr:OpgC domain-containing protein [Bradyrhizobium sp.]MBV9563029.1 OpgC domain-containing protein [Bradyrhizobium sp.]